MQIFDKTKIRSNLRRNKFLISPSTTIKLFYFLSFAALAMGVFSILNQKAVSGTVANNAAAISAITSSRQVSYSAREVEDRLTGALWSYFAGDALSSPTHWYYGGERQIISEYGSKITDYTTPNKRLSGSILNKSDLDGGGRSKSRTTGSTTTTIIGDIINHGKEKLWSPNESNHYHGTLARGENTLEVSIARVLMKSIVDNDGVFVADHFRNAYVRFMTTPGSHNDTYASTCHRMFFANLIFRQLPPEDCADNDRHNVDTIDGLVLPTLVALTGLRNRSKNDEGGLEQIEKSVTACAAVTRRSSVLENTSSMWASVVLDAVSNPNDDDFLKTLDTFSMNTIKRPANPRVLDASTMSACYLSSSLPGLVDMIAKYMPTSDTVNRGDLVWKGLLANANVGGENVHRGSIMGCVLGARAGLNQLPLQLMNGLHPYAELKKEIDDFVIAVLPNGKLKA